MRNVLTCYELSVTFQLICYTHSWMDCKHNLAAVLGRLDIKLQLTDKICSAVGCIVYVCAFYSNHTPF